MAKNRDNRNQPPQTQKADAAPPIVEQKGPLPGSRCDCCGQLVPDPGAVKQHLRCPSCYGGRQGVGVERWHARKGNVMRRCYQCNQCGFDWTIDCKEIIEPLQISYQEITIQTRQG